MFIQNKQQKSSILAFTIVELLVVVVVIGILATVTIVSYNGIAKRAYNAKTLSIIDGYRKTFELYYIDNNAYPGDDAESSWTSYYCLGEESDYPADVNFAAGQCVKSEAFGDIYTNEIINNELKSFMNGNIINGSLPTVSFDEDKFRGVFYYISAGHPSILVYEMNGNTDCVIGREFSQYNNVTTCILDLANKSSRPEPQV